MNRIYTIGYGSNSPDEFIERLKAAGITLIIDVRRVGSMSWCVAYHSGRNMRHYLMLNGNIAYVHWHWISNQFDELIDYKRWLDSSDGMAESCTLAGTIKNSAENNGMICCLLCACDNPFKKDKMPRCHRVYVADDLVRLLGDGWNVEHL